MTTIRSRYNQALAVDCGAAGWHASSARVPGHTSPVTRSEAFAFTAAKNP
ncbi:hypothetical protein ACRYGX_02450 [Mycobacteroides abscessus]